MIRKPVAAFVMILFAASIHTTALAAEFKAGDITGWGVPPKNWNQHDSFSKTFARQAARMDALRNLVEAIDGVTVTSDAPLSELFSTDSRVVTRVSQDSKVFRLLEKNARQVGETKFATDEDGDLYCEVTMEVTIPNDWHK